MKSRSYSRLLQVFILSVILLVVWVQWLVQGSLSQQRDDSTLINASGRQRMLSQRLVNRSLQLERTADQEHVDLLQGSLDEFQNGFLALMDGNLKGGTQFDNSTEVREIFDKMQPVYDGLVEEVSSVIANRNLDRSEGDKIISLGESFLGNMEAVVAQYNKEAQQRVTGLQKTELILAFITVFVILIQIQFLYRPMILGLQKSNEELARKNKALESFAYFTSHNIRRPVANILGLSMHIEPGGEGDEEEHETIEKLKEEAENLDALVRDSYQILQKNRDERN